VRERVNEDIELCTSLLNLQTEQTEQTRIHIISVFDTVELSKGNQRKRYPKTKDRTKFIPVTILDEKKVNLTGGFTYDLTYTYYNDTYNDIIDTTVTEFTVTCNTGKTITFQKGIYYFTKYFTDLEPEIPKAVIVDSEGNPKNVNNEPKGGTRRRRYRRKTKKHLKRNRYYRKKSKRKR